jgi:hypothetical protein
MNEETGVLQRSINASLNGEPRFLLPRFLLRHFYHSLPRPTHAR